MNTNIERLSVIDGASLMSQPLRPLNFIFNTLISQGLHILAGSPKVGKSWLALWLAVTVAKGENVWGMSVKHGTTLYLCLEDSTLRIQNRLFEITDSAPENVHFCTNSYVLGRGLEQQLETFLKEHLDTVLVIIDTLQMIRSTNYDNTYANDYRDLTAIPAQPQSAVQLIPVLRWWRNAGAVARRAYPVLDVTLSIGGWNFIAVRKTYGSWPPTA